MLTLTRLHLGIAHESQFQGLGIRPPSPWPMAGEEILKGEIAKIFEKLGPALTGWWSRRPARRAAAAAASLQFWPNGMLKQLELIAQKKGSRADFKELRRQFEETEEPVEKIINELEEIRSVLVEREDGVQIIELINQIIFGPVGKRMIRNDIDFILKNKKDKDAIAARALEVCNAIAAFNAATNRLHRLVYSS